MTALRAVLYARVSTDTGEQDPESQLSALRPWATGKGWRIIAEEADRVTCDPRRRKKDPPGLSRAIRAIEERRADVLCIFAADRLVADPVPLLLLVERIQSLGGKIASYQEGQDLDTTTDTGLFMTMVMGWLNRMRLRLCRAASIAGQKRARAEGRHPGRPRVKTTYEQVADLRVKQVAWREIGRKLGISAQSAKRLWCAKNPRVDPPPVLEENVQP